VATSMMEWEVVVTDNTLTARLCEEFGTRYGFDAEEASTLKLCLMYGLEDGEIASYMKITPEGLETRLESMIGKTRTRSVRELQALFLRFILIRLPA